MILVAGSTGLLGSEICRQLIAKQKPVRALIRKTSAPVKIEALKQMGCGLAEGDFKDKDSLIKACGGCDTVISTVSSTLSRQEGDNVQTVDHDGNLSLVAAAKETGVKHFIFISFRHQYAKENPLTEAKRSAEHAIKSSGMTYTILQASFFMELWLSQALGFHYADHTAQIPGDGNQPISFVSYKDVAAFAVASVDNTTAKNKTLEIGGPEAVSPAQVIKVFEKISQHPFIVNYIPVAALQQQADESTDYWQRIFTNIMIFYANGDAMDMNPVLEKIPVRLHSVNEYAKAVLKKEEAVI